jgi:hypothetical protein
MPVPPDWPDDEADVDREIRIEKMKRELDEIAGGKMISGSFGPLPIELEEMFLEQVLAYERAEFDTDFNRLVQRGLALPPEAELDDASLSMKLAEVIYELAALRSRKHGSSQRSRALQMALEHWPARRYRGSLGDVGWSVAHESDRWVQRRGYGDLVQVLRRRGRSASLASRFS